MDRWESWERAAEQREGRISVPASGGGRWQPLALERVRDHLSVRLWVREKVKNFSADAERLERIKKKFKRFDIQARENACDRP